MDSKSKKICCCSTRILCFLIGWSLLSLSIVVLGVGIDRIVNVDVEVQSLKATLKVYNQLALDNLRFPTQLYAVTLILIGILGFLMSAVFIFAVKKRDAKLVKEWWVIYSVVLVLYFLEYLIWVAIKESDGIAMLRGMIEFIIAFTILRIVGIYAEQLKEQNPVSVPVPFSDPSQVSDQLILPV